MTVLYHSSSSTVASLDGAGLCVKDRWLVRGVSLSMVPGRIVTLIGPNGAGKSTTARLLLGLQTPTEGHAWQKPDLRVGYVPQSLSIDWTLPIRVNRFMRLTCALTQDAIQTALDHVGAGHLGHSLLHTLSGGELQRVLLARALTRQPHLLVMDEPVQGVDFAGQTELYRLIADLKDTLGCAILLISHDLHVVMRATDQVICLNGHVCCQGHPIDVMNDPTYQALFGLPALHPFVHHATDSPLALYRHTHRPTAASPASSLTSSHIACGESACDKS